MGLLQGFSIRDNEVVHISSWKNSTVHLKYSVSSKTHSESTLFQLEPSHKVKDGRQRERRGGLGGWEGRDVWRDGLVVRPQHRWFSQRKTVRVQLAGVQEKNWIICPLIQQRRNLRAHGSRPATICTPQVRFRLYLPHDLDYKLMVNEFRVCCGEFDYCLIIWSWFLQHWGVHRPSPAAWSSFQTPLIPFL